ncbi:glycosyltransferase family 4 protein [Flavobacterium sp.]|uniref:glycosyltransferase family 4 protein n=1 Tax=Flavobacterium sp. TaxID=239 RepID=UPI00374D0816
MKIGLILPSVPGYSETFFRNKIKGLMDSGFEVTLFVVDNRSNEKMPCTIIPFPNYYIHNKIVVFWHSLVQIISNSKTAIRLYNLGKKDGLSTKKSVRMVFLNSHFLNQKLDWLHFTFGTLAEGRENVAKAIGAKMAVSFRGFDHYVYPQKNKNCYKLLFSKKVQYHVLSEGMKKDLMANGIHPKSISKIAPAIDTSLFFSTVQNNDNLNILTVARLHWIKGITATLEALAILKKKEIRFQYTIIGSGAEKEKLQFAVHQLGLTNEVIFAGKRNPDEVKSELQKANLYIQYSHQEGFCNAVLEAQAMGKICIVSDAVGLTENVINNVTGFVVPKRNPLSLATKIRTVNELSSKEKEMISEAAINRVKSQFNIEDQVTKFIEFYENY